MPNNNVATVLTTISNPAPVIICPPGVTARTANPSDTSAAVTYPAPSVTDNCTNSTVECAPPSGSIFPVGSNTVTCTVRDAAGARANCTFPVTVTNTAAASDLVITQAVTPESVESNSNISYTVRVTNNGPEVARDVVAMNALPPEVRLLFFDVTAGILFTTEQTGNALTVRFPAFGVGETATIRVTGRVICATVDGASLTGTASVSSSLADPNTENNSATATARAVNPPPLMVCPANVRVDLPNGGQPDGMTVNYPLPNLFDNCEGAIATCNPPPGSVFPVGVTTVNCLGADTGTRIINCSFTVTVQTVVVDPVLMLITGASVSGKKLFVFGLNFPAGSVILVNNEPQKTKNASSAEVHNSVSRSTEAVLGSDASTAPLTAPIDVPKIKSGMMRASSSARSMPTSLAPSTPPPPRTKATVGSLCSFIAEDCPAFHWTAGPAAHDLPPRTCPCEPSRCAGGLSEPRSRGLRRAPTGRRPNLAARSRR